jgi:hypothetical protein
VLGVGCGRTAPHLSLLNGRARELKGIDVVAFETTTRRSCATGRASRRCRHRDLID